MNMLPAKASVLDAQVLSAVTIIVMRELLSILSLALETNDRVTLNVCVPISEGNVGLAINVLSL
jgi:hypothetical protein